VGAGLRADAGAGDRPAREYLAGALGAGPVSQSDAVGRVEAKLYNFKTGEIFPLPDYPEYEGGGAVALTSREKQVLKLVRDGFLSEGISEQLRISVHMVNTYRQRIIEKLNVNNSLEAIRLAMRLGLLD
jgi:DNA-binding NarL/FixJ family response regulator